MKFTYRLKEWKVELRAIPAGHEVHGVGDHAEGHQQGVHSYGQRSRPYTLNNSK